MPSCLAKFKEIFRASLNLDFVTSCLVTLSIFPKIGMLCDRNPRLRRPLRKIATDSSRFAMFLFLENAKKSDSISGSRSRRRTVADCLVEISTTGALETFFREWTAGDFVSKSTPLPN